MLAEIGTFLLWFKIGVCVTALVIGLTAIYFKIFTWLKVDTTTAKFGSLLVTILTMAIVLLITIRP